MLNNFNKATISNTKLTYSRLCHKNRLYYVNIVEPVSILKYIKERGDNYILYKPAATLDKLSKALVIVLNTSSLSVIV